MSIPLHLCRTMLIALSLYVLLHAPLMAQSNQSLIFRRDTITIVPAAEPEVQSLNSKKKTQNKVKTAQRKPVEIDTEIRSEQALQLDWMYSMGQMKEKEAVMILFHPPYEMPITAMNFYEPLDIISVSPEGVIVQIVPELVLSGLSAPIPIDQPIFGRLYMKAGEVKKHRIKPGDTVEHPLFRPAPQVLTQ